MSFRSVGALRLATEAFLIETINTNSTMVAYTFMLHFGKILTDNDVKERSYQWCQNM